MAISLAGNNKNDLYLDSSGNIAIVRDLQAVLQDCENIMKAQRGEMIFQIDQGVPTLATVWNKLNIGQFTAAAITQIMRVAGVVKVVSFTANQDGENLNYVATIQTIYGTKDIAGDLLG